MAGFTLREWREPMATTGKIGTIDKDGVRLGYLEDCDHPHWGVMAVPISAVPGLAEEKWRVWFCPHAEARMRSAWWLWSAMGSVGVFSKRWNAEYEAFRLRRALVTNSWSRCIRIVSLEPLPERGPWWCDCPVCWEGSASCGETG